MIWNPAFATLFTKQGVLSCMTEAGGVFSAALFDAGLVDEVVVYIAPLSLRRPPPRPSRERTAWIS